jgi:hypothetical protein
MGYELYWRDVPVGKEPLGHAPERGCFELVEWDMTATCTAMDEFGMLEPASAPPTIKPESFGLSNEPEFYTEDGDRIEYPIDTAEGLYQRAIIAIQRGDTGARIPTWKLASNGAWLVTPEEIERSLQAYTAIVAGDHDAAASCAPPVPSLTWWDEWIDFLRAAVDHGGIEVY